jgi:hypothetical protein
MHIQKACIYSYVKHNMAIRVPMRFELKLGLEHEKTGSYRILEAILCL